MTGAAPELGGAPTGPALVLHPDEQAVADVTAGRLLAVLVEAQAARGVASVVLTGGGVGIKLLESLAVAPGRDALDWSRVDIWWGDERWVGADDPDRNEKQARDALLSKVAVDPARVHPMASSDASATPEEAAAAYAEALAGAAVFDVVLLGIGPEGHIASLFPDSPGIQEQSASVVAVHDCPKPPPTRVSLTLPALNAAREVWLVVSGDGKADAVAHIVAGAAAVDVPAAGVRGTERTLLLVDRAAASKL